MSPRPPSLSPPPPHFTSIALPPKSLSLFPLYFLFDTLLYAFSSASLSFVLVEVLPVPLSSVSDLICASKRHDAVSQSDVTYRVTACTAG